MSTQKQNKPKELIPIKDLVNLDKANLDEITDRLWYEYFDPAEPNDAVTKLFIMEQYNYVVNINNKRAGFKRQINLTKGTYWANKSQNYADMKRALYVDVKVYDKQKQAKVTSYDVIDAAMAQVKAIVSKPIDRAKIKPYAGTKGKVVHMETTNETENERQVRASSDKWIKVYEMSNAGKSNDEIITETGYTAKQVRDAIYRYKTNRVKGALTKP